MKYTAPSFTVPASGKSPENCQHGWASARDGRCVFCGTPVDPNRFETGGQTDRARRGVPCE